MLYLQQKQSHLNIWVSRRLKPTMLCPGRGLGQAATQGQIWLNCENNGAVDSRGHSHDNLVLWLVTVLSCDYPLLSFLMAAVGGGVCTERHHWRLLQYRVVVVAWMIIILGTWGEGDRIASESRQYWPSTIHFTTDYMLSYNQHNNNNSNTDNY